MTGSLEQHKVVSRNEWLKARKMLLKKEKEFTVLRDQLRDRYRAKWWKDRSISITSFRCNAWLT
jgi:predicted dithiol-disulfide oxidoreductase (DUF899 family)